jgi:hypothetical protein
MEVKMGEADGLRARERHRERGRERVRVRERVCEQCDYVSLSFSLSLSLGSARTALLAAAAHELLASRVVDRIQLRVLPFLLSIVVLKVQWSLASGPTFKITCSLTPPVDRHFEK